MSDFAVSQRGYREDDMGWVFRARREGLSVDELLADAVKVRAFMDSTGGGGDPDWSHVSAMADVLVERDEALTEVSRLGALLAENVRDLDEARANLTAGVLMAVRRQAEHTLTEAGQIAIRRAVAVVAGQFGVAL